MEAFPGSESGSTKLHDGGFGSTELHSGEAPCLGAWGQVRGLNDRTPGAARAAADGLDVLIHGVFFFSFLIYFCRRAF
jgi:hypothetical protein